MSGEPPSPWVAALERREFPPELLAQLGEPDPEKAHTHLGEVVREPDLSPHVHEWLPGLLTSARPGFGAHCLRDVATRYRQIRRRPLPPECLPALARVLGSSDFLARLLRRHANWSELLCGSTPAAPPEDPVDPDWTSIRIAKYQGLLRIAARDLLGRNFEQSLAELSGLADRCLRAALDRSAQESECPQPALFALGKLGGRELNFSSDVDLLVLYEAEERDEDLRLNRETARLVQIFKRNLEVASEDGFGYRVDLDLRPEGRCGVLANSVDAALDYYEAFGAEWERQALLRLRHVAGPSDVAIRFEHQVTPFVFRRGIDPAAIGNVRSMKHRIEEARRNAGRDLEADLKEGPGGIRDLEFFVQALQLLYGGRHPTVRTGNILTALDRMMREKLLPEDTATRLRTHYLWLRRAEHALQLHEERQTHAFPRDLAGRVALARRMGYDDPNAQVSHQQLMRDLDRVRSEVRNHFDSLVFANRG